MQKVVSIYRAQTRNTINFLSLPLLFSTCTEKYTLRYQSDLFFPFDIPMVIPAAYQKDVVALTLHLYIRLLLLNLELARRGESEQCMMAFPNRNTSSDCVQL
jgi:hypothetical protein